MITFKRDGKEIQVRVTHGIVPNKAIVFTAECENEFLAQIMADRFTHILEKKLSQKIEQAYLEGYKTGKNHSKKKTKFVGTFDTQIW